MKTILATVVASLYLCSGFAHAASVSIEDLKLDHEKGSITAMENDSSYHHHHHHHHHHHGYYHGYYHGYHGHHGHHHHHHFLNETDPSSAKLPSPQK